MKRAPRGAGRGLTIIDLIVVITLTGLIAGTMTVLFSDLSARSAEALRAHEAEVLAHSLLAEARTMPFTYCDPQDARAALATGAFLGGTGCASTVDQLGPEPGESRYNALNRFDGVSDYRGFTMPGPGCATLCDRTGTPWPSAGRLSGCQASLAITALALPGIAALDANGQPQALRIVVTVACPGRSAVLAEGVRVRHSPTSP